MVALIEQGEAHEAHPAYWAPFVVVGEGSGVQLASNPLPTSSIVPGPQSHKNVPPASQARPSKAVKKQDWRTDVWR